MRLFLPTSDARMLLEFPETEKPMTRKPILDFSHRNLNAYIYRPRQDDPWQTEARSRVYGFVGKPFDNILATKRPMMVEDKILVGHLAVYSGFILSPILEADGKMLTEINSCSRIDNKSDFFYSME